MCESSGLRSPSRRRPVGTDAAVRLADRLLRTLRTDRREAPNHAQNCRRTRRYLSCLQPESRVSLVIPRGSILLPRGLGPCDNLLRRVRPAVTAVPDSPSVGRARQRPQMARWRVGCALHVASAAPGLSPPRHCGNTLAPTPTPGLRAFASLSLARSGRDPPQASFRAVPAL